jgi:hypothetical protein
MNASKLPENEDDWIITFSLNSGILSSGKS